MLGFFGRSVVQKLITLFCISVLSFLIIHLAPGTSAQIDPTNPMFTKENLEQYRKEFHLDRPLYVQYYLFYKNLFTGKLLSRKDGQPVLAKIWRRFLNSLPLFVVGTILTWTLAFPVGIAAAIRRGSMYDRTTTFLAYLLISIPGFFLAYILIIFVVSVFHVPVIGMRTPGLSGVTALMDRTWHLLLPSLLGATGGIAVLSRYVRSQMLEVESQDYIRTARAKGLSERTVIMKHALRNSMIPVITLFASILPILIGGSIVIEIVFDLPGMGEYMYRGLLSRDYNIIMAVMAMTSAMTLAGILMSDIAYALIDPRISYS